MTLGLSTYLADTHSQMSYEWAETNLRAFIAKEPKNLLDVVAFYTPRPSIIHAFKRSITQLNFCPLGRIEKIMSVVESSIQTLQTTASRNTRNNSLIIEAEIKLEELQSTYNRYAQESLDDNPLANLLNEQKIAIEEGQKNRLKELNESIINHLWSKISDSLNNNQTTDITPRYYDLLALTFIDFIKNPSNHIRFNRYLSDKPKVDFFKYSYFLAYERGRLTALKDRCVVLKFYIPDTNALETRWLRRVNEAAIKAYEYALDCIETVGFTSEILQNAYDICKQSLEKLEAFVCYVSFLKTIGFRNKTVFFDAISDFPLISYTDNKKIAQFLSVLSTQFYLNASNYENCSVQQFFNYVTCLARLPIIKQSVELY